MRQIPCALGGRAYVEVWREEGALCVERLVIFHLPSLTPLFSTLSNVKGAWLLGGGRPMAGLSGFASHWCSLHFGAGYQ